MFPLFVYSPSCDTVCIVSATLLPPCWRNSQCDMPFQMPLRWRFDWNVDVLKYTCHHKKWGHAVKCKVCRQWTLLGNMDVSNHNVILTPWSRVLLEKLTSSQLVKKFPAFYGTRRFNIAFTSACHLSLFRATSIQSIPPHPTFWRSILILSSHLCLGLPSKS